MNTQFLTRQTQLRQSLAAAEIDALLVFGYENIRYITGFSGHAAYVVVTQSALFLITDYRYSEQAQTECHNTQVICRDRDNESLGHCVNRLLPATAKIGFEASNISVALWQSIAAELSVAKCIAVEPLIERMRMVKDHWEVKQIQLAAAIADQALNEVLAYFATGVTERDIALELEYRMQKLGSEGLSFDTIMLFAERTSLPHGVPSTQKLKVGDFITLDFGAVVNGYRSDMTRSYIYAEASQKQREIYQTVADAQAAAMAQVRANTPAINSFNASREVLVSSPYGQYAGEGLGHGVGLFLHEHPFIKPGCEYVLEAGNVITIEPGIYIPNYGGVRLEEDILVTETGYQLLTHAPKPMILPERN